MKKITFIILTDSLCWLPFITVSALHYYDVINAEHYYAFFSIIIIPINSVINPFLYDDHLADALTRVYKKAKLFVRYFVRRGRSISVVIMSERLEGQNGQMNRSDHTTELDNIVESDLPITTTFNDSNIQTQTKRTTSSDI